MKVLFDSRSEAGGYAPMYLDFKDLENEKSGLLYAYGIHPGYRMQRPNRANYIHTIYYEGEEPNGFTNGQLPQDRGNWDLSYWTKIIHTCPYCAKWENDLYGTDKFRFGFHQVNPKNNPIIDEKTYSVNYIGGLGTGNTIFRQIVEVIKDVPNYRFVSYMGYPHATNVLVSYHEKLRICAQTKISIAANILHMADLGAAERQFRCISSMPRWKDNEAFKRVCDGFMPQIKLRVLEAAIGRSLLLVLKDDWNTIEYLFKPNMHFLYFDSISTLKAKIDECLSNWSYCEKIIDNMYNECMSNHTIQSFYNKYLKEYDV